MEKQPVDPVQEVKMPDFLAKLPAYLWAGWAEYNGEVKFVMINYEKSIKCHRPIIDLGYCATKLMINNIVEKSVTYYPDHFKEKIF